MATPTVAEPINEVRRAHATAGGDVVTAGTPVRFLLPRGTAVVQLIPRDFTGSALVAQFGLSHAVDVLRTTDGLLSGTDNSAVANDNQTSTSFDLNSQPTLANGGALYVGSVVPFAGLITDIGNTNATASVMTVHYWDGNSWEDISATDGTASGGATLAQDGNITWTVPTDWAAASLREANPTLHGSGARLIGNKAYWVRISVGAALDASVSILRLTALPRSTAFAELPSGFSQEFAVHSSGRFRVVAITADADADTVALIVNCIVRGDSPVFA